MILEKYVSFTCASNLVQWCSIAMPLWECWEEQIPHKAALQLIVAIVYYRSYFCVQNYQTPAGFVPVKEAKRKKKHWLTAAGIGQCGHMTPPHIDMQTTSCLTSSQETQPLSSLCPACDLLRHSSRRQCAYRKWTAVQQLHLLALFCFL